MAGELILIVEDNPRNLKLVRELPLLHGFRTIEAMSAAEVVAAARTHSPRLVLLDMLR